MWLKKYIKTHVMMVQLGRVFYMPSNNHGFVLKKKICWLHFSVFVIFRVVTVLPSYQNVVLEI